MARGIRPGKEIVKNLSNTEALRKWRESHTKEEISAQAAKAGSQSRKRFTKISEAMRYILTCRVQDDDLAQRLTDAGFGDTYAAAIAFGQIDKATMTGDSVSAKMSLEVSEGKIPDRVELSGVDGKPIESLDLSKLSDDDLRKLISTKQDVAPVLHIEDQE